MSNEANNKEKESNEFLKNESKELLYMGSNPIPGSNNMIVVYQHLGCENVS